MPSLITLTTDFGTRDAYVAAMKGTIASIHRDVTFIDISHDIDPQDVMQAAFVLRGAVPYFPEGTIHLVVVDPGVGTERRAVGVRDGSQYFVGPDNGLLTLALAPDEPDHIVQLDKPAFWRADSPSDTFHGRDIFAPVAAHLAAGRTLDDVGTPVDKLSTLHWALPTIDEHGIQGWVVHVDHFGNCITNISRQAFEELRDGRGIKCFAGGAILHAVHPVYASVADGDPLAIFNSDGFLEIAVNGGDASSLLGIRKGAPVNVVFSRS